MTRTVRDEVVYFSNRGHITVNVTVNVSEVAAGQWIATTSLRTRIFAGLGMADVIQGNVETIPDENGNDTAVFSSEDAAVEYASKIFSNVFIAAKLFAPDFALGCLDLIIDKSQDKSIPIHNNLN